MSRRRRSDCALTLASLSKPSNIPGLEQALQSGNSVTGEAAAAALANIGNADACRILANHAEAGGELSEVSGWAIAQVRSPYGQEALLSIAGESKSSEVGGAAAEALGSYNSSHVAEQLRLLVNAEKNGAVRDVLSSSIDAISERVTKDSAGASADGAELVEASE